MSSRPIFLHTMFRTGGTYLFHVFRRSPAGYTTYYEPVHYIYGLPDVSIAEATSGNWDNRHNVQHSLLEERYYTEYLPIEREIKQVFRIPMAYEQAFLEP